MFTKPIKIALVSLTALLAVLLAYNAAVMAATTVDQENDASDASYSFGAGGTCRAAGTTFKNGPTTENVAVVSFYLRRVGNLTGTDGLTLKVSSASSTPDAAGNLASQFYDASAVNAAIPDDGSFHWVDFSLTAPADVSPGQQTAAWITQAEATAAIHFAYQNGTGTYAPGTLLIGEPGCDNPWGNAFTSDARFRTYTADATQYDLTITSQTGFPGDEDVNISGTCHVLDPGETWESEYDLGDYGLVKLEALREFNGILTAWSWNEALCELDVPSGYVLYEEVMPDLAQGWWTFRAIQETNIRTYVAERRHYIDSASGTIGAIYGPPPIINFEPLEGCTEDEGDFSCLLTRTIQGFFSVAPLTWFSQIRYAVLNESSTTTHSAAFTLPSSVDGGQQRTITIYQSGSSSGIVGRMNAIGTFGNSAFDWQDLVSMAVWSATLVVAWRFVETLWETV